MSPDLKISNEPQKSRERHPFSASVAIILEYRQPRNFGYAEGLILGTQKKTNQLCFLAGGIEKDENPREAIAREIGEESGLDPESLKISGNPEVIVIPGRDKSRIGLVYKSNSAHIPINLEGFVPNSPEISLVRPYLVDELVKLVTKPDLWYKPEFNLKIVTEWLEDFFRMKYGDY